MKADTIRRTGVVTKIHGAMYEVKDSETEHSILCTLNGKMKMNSIRLTIGDKVEVEVSIYDLTKGRVVYRFK